MTCNIHADTGSAEEGHHRELITVSYQRKREKERDIQSKTWQDSDSIVGSSCSCPLSQQQSLRSRKKRRWWWCNREKKRRTPWVEDKDANQETGDNPWNLLMNPHHHHLLSSSSLLFFQRKDSLTLMNGMNKRFRGRDWEKKKEIEDWGPAVSWVEELFTEWHYLLSSPSFFSSDTHSADVKPSEKKSIRERKEHSTQQQESWPKPVLMQKFLSLFLSFLSVSCLLINSLFFFFRPSSYKTLFFLLFFHDSSDGI